MSPGTEKGQSLKKKIVLMDSCLLEMTRNVFGGNAGREIPSRLNWLKIERNSHSWLFRSEKRVNPDAAYGTVTASVL
jgi:hypothetical protein